jgi:hypothetical protein
LPARGEWDELVNFAGGDSAGAGLKSKAPDWDGEDAYGFSAMPGGTRDASHRKYFNLGTWGRWWSATQRDASSAYIRAMSAKRPDADEYDFGKLNGFSVRCVQDKVADARTAEAEGEDQYIKTWDCGADSGTVQCAIDKKGTMWVRGTGAMKDYDRPPWRDIDAMAGIINAVVTEGVTYIGKLAFAETDLMAAAIPASVTKIGHNAFLGCSNLISIFVAAGNANYRSEEGVLFMLNNNRTALLLYPPARPDTSYAIPDGVTNIGSAAFNGCANLTSITIPSSVKNINVLAFDGSYNLKTMTSLNPVPPRIDLPFESDKGRFSGLKACLYVPKSSPWAYRNADGWKELRCAISPIGAKSDYKDCDYEDEDDLTPPDSDVSEKQVKEDPPEETEVSVSDDGEDDGSASFEQEVLGKLEDDHVTKLYWSAGEGEKRAPLQESDEKGSLSIAQYYYNLNLEVIINWGNDGKVVEATLENDDGEVVELNAVASGNKIIFEQVFTTHRPERKQARRDDEEEKRYDNEDDGYYDNEHYDNEHGGEEHEQEGQKHGH